MSVSDLPELNVVHQAHVVDFFGALPDGCIQCVVTSPPYWGLRVYGTPPIVWGGDSECEHEWLGGTLRRNPTYVADGGATSQRKGRTHQQGHVILGTNRNFIGEGGRGSNNPSITSEGGFCFKCDGWLGHYGLEPTIDLYVEHCVMWMRALWPKLRKDGVVFLNLGDSYAGSWGSTGHTRETKNLGKSTFDQGCYPQNPPTAYPKRMGLKPKDLVMMPARVALALQADGWWLRSDIVWAKPNPMPESVTDRPTKAHEYVFLLTKSKNYFYDADAVREPHKAASIERDHYAYNKAMQGRYFTPGEKRGPERACARKKTVATPHVGGRRQAPEPGEPNALHPAGRNLRSVWRFPTKPTPAAHFATFPDRLPETCILAGSSPRACPECGGPWERVVQKVPATMNIRIRDAKRGVATAAEGYAATPEEIANYGPERMGSSRTLGFRPTCACYNDRYIRDFPQARAARKQYQHWVTGNWWKRVRKRPGRDHWPHDKQIVCDPFAGTATTGVVAIKHGRDFLGCDLMGGDKDFKKGGPGVEHHTANDRLGAAGYGENLLSYKFLEGTLGDGQLTLLEP